jgi:hypothetical protein
MPCGSALSARRQWTWRDTVLLHWHKSLAQQITGGSAPARWRTLLDFDVWQPWSMHGLAARAHTIEQVPCANPRVRVNAPAKSPAAVPLARQRLLDARQAQAALNVQEAELDADLADMQPCGPVRLQTYQALSAPLFEYKLLCTERQCRSCAYKLSL